MHSIYGAIDDVGAQCKQVVDYSGYGCLVAGDWGSRDNNCISGHYLHVAVVLVCNAIEYASGLSLTTRDYQHRSVCIFLPQLMQGNEGTVLRIQVA